MSKKAKRLNVKVNDDQDLENEEFANEPEDQGEDNEKFPEEEPEEKSFGQKIKESKPVCFIKKHGAKAAAFVIGVVAGVGVTAWAASKTPNNDKAEIEGSTGLPELPGGDGESSQTDETYTETSSEEI